MSVSESLPSDEASESNKLTIKKKESNQGAFH